jgi:hypothetical protein
MGNACGCAEDRNDTGPTGNLTPTASVYTPYKIPNFQSKITPQAFASIPAAEKDSLLVEAFNILVSTVDLSKVKTSNPTIKSLTVREKGKATNKLGEEYEGEFINGVANGNGKIVNRKDGSTYTGGMFNGVCHGEGQVEFPDKKWKVNFYKGQPFGLFHETVTKPEKVIVEGGCDEQGYQSGPQYSISEKGDITYRLMKDDKEDGLQITIPKNREAITVVERKGTESKPIGTYVLKQGQPVAAK